MTKHTDLTTNEAVNKESEQDYTQLHKQVDEQSISANNIVDPIWTGSDDDVILTGDDDDIIYSGAGDDDIYSSGGNNQIWAGEGDDIILTGEGNDIIHSGEGDDIVTSYNGNNQIWTDAGDDVIETGFGDDIIHAGTGNNSIVSFDGNNQIWAGEGDDEIETGYGNDIIHSGAGNDSVFSYGGNNQIWTDAGDDSVETGEGNDIIYSGKGDDTIYSDAGNNQIWAGEGDDNIETGEGNDIIYSGEGDDTIYSEDGDNQIWSDAGYDYIETGYGNDIIYSGEGDDDVWSYGGDNRIWTGEGLDDIETGYGDDVIYSGEGDDIILTYGGDNRIWSGSGDDYVETGSGNDMIYAGEGNDDIFSEGGDNRIWTGSGEDYVKTGSGNDDIYSGDGDDIVISEGGSNYIETGTGNDIIITADGDDTILSGLDHDLVLSGAGDDNINAGAGEDFIDAGEGSDFADGGSGDDVFSHLFESSENAIDSDTYYGGDGQDTLALSISAEDLERPEVQADLERFYEYASSDLKDTEEFKFETMNLTVKSIENLELDIFEANDDEFTTEENVVLTADVIANDSGAVLDDIKIIEVNDPSKGEISIVDNKIVFDPKDHFDYLADGETETVSVEYTVVNEANGLTSTAEVTINVIGTNDVPVITGNMTGNVSEDNIVFTSKSLEIVDADHDQSSFQATQAVGEYGSLYMTENGDWSYLLDNESDHVQALAENEVVYDTFEVTSKDGSATETVTIEINGSNDAPVQVDNQLYLSDDVGSVNLDVLASFTDIDNNDNLHLENVMVADGKGLATIVDGQIVYDTQGEYEGLYDGESEFVYVDYDVVDDFGGVTHSQAAIRVNGLGHPDKSIVAEVDHLSTVAPDTTVFDFNTVRDTKLTDKGEYQITDESGKFDGGAVWSNQQLDLTKSFTVDANLFFGNKDLDGADGLAFVLQNQSNSELGNLGGALGYKGIENSFAIEFDTFQNYSLHDIETDHIAFLTDGNVKHNSDFSAPVDVGNLEDGRYHDVQVQWNADDKTVSLLMDGAVKHSAQIDLISEIGSDVAYFGYTGATGSKNNVQLVDDLDITYENNDTSFVVDVLANDHYYDGTDGDFTIVSADIFDDHGSISIVDNKIVLDFGNDFDNLEAGEKENIAIEYTVTDGYTSSTGYAFVDVYGNDTII